MAFTQRQLGITHKPMGPTAGIGDLQSTLGPAPPAIPATALDTWWNRWGNTIWALSTVFFVAIAIPPARRQS